MSALPVESDFAPASVAEVFAREGALEQVSGNRPFLLQGPETCWYLASGTIEVFTVGLQEGRPEGVRSNFMTVQPESLLLGMDLDRYGYQHGFLAVGLVGTEIYQMPLTRLQELSADPRYAGEVGALLERWVQTLSAGIVKDIHPRPQGNLPLEGDQESALDTSSRALAKKEPVWFRMLEGEAVFLGMEELMPESSDVLFPLTTDTWIEAYGPARLAALTTAQAVAQPGIWPGLDLFHEALCQCEFLNKRLVAVDEFNRLRTKADYRRAAKESAISEIVGVLEPGHAAHAQAAAGAADPLFAACRLIGEAQGIAIRAHPEPPQPGSKVDPVAAIAKASQVRMRKVALRDDWHHRDQGPLLAFFTDGHRPVALLPTKPGTYEAVDTTTGERAPLTAAVAAAMEPFAISFYRHFPAGPLKAWDLMKFGARGLGKDARTVVLMGVCMGVLGSLTPYLSGQIFDSVIPGSERGQLLQFCLGMMVAAVAVAAFSVVRGIAMLRIEGQMDYSIQAALWDRLLNLPATFFREYTAGDLADRAAGIDAIRQTVSGVGLNAILGVLSGVFYLGLLFKYDTKLALTGVALVAISMAITIFTNFLQLRFQREQFKVRGKVAGLVLQLINGVSKIRVAGAEDHAFKVWARGFAAQKRVSYKAGRVGNFLEVFNAGFPLLTNLVIFFTLVGLQVAALKAQTPPTMTTGSFIAFNAAFGMFLTAMLGLSQASLSMLAVLPIFERLKPILTTPPEVDEAKAYPGELMGEIELYHINFRYDPKGAFILQDLTLTIKPGEFVALVGPSGSGKSTLLRLLLGFEKPEAGNVYYDRQDLAMLDLREVRNQVGVVLQTSRVMPTDVFHNIIGTRPLTLDDAWAAAASAGLEKDIREMPMGMHTVVSEGGSTFSGGQRQRLMIARAIVNRPRILFFDEATSALDNRTQQIVSESLESLHATRVVIAHRLSTVQNAHRIIVLVNGKVVQQGTYAELMAVEGAFKELAKRQIA